MYMSYCRFEGTSRELAACLNEVEDHISGCAEYKVSANEILHFRRMMEQVVEFMADNELLDEDGYLDYDKLDEVCEAMATACIGLLIDMVAERYGYDPVELARDVTETVVMVNRDLGPYREKVMA